MIKVLKITSALLVAMFVAAPAVSQVPEGIVTAQILTGWRTESGTHLAGVRMDLAQGWKTYWRAPGSGGIPPKFDWTGSNNIKSVLIHWPSPGVFENNGIRSIGYKDQVVLPIEFTPLDPSQPIVLRAKVDLGVCETVCVPVSLRLAAELAATGHSPDNAITRAIASGPDTAHSAGVRDVRCTIEPIADGLRLTAQVNMPSIGSGEIAVVEHADQTIWISDAATRRNGRVLNATVEMVPQDAQPFSLNRSDIRITVIGPSGAVNIEGCTG